MKNFSLTYRPENPPALDKINLSIESGEKVGICGRTGSGKSSLALSLFRLFEPDDVSQYEIDGNNCMEMGLKKLRKAITIIPQEPVLFSSSLRRNLDPFGQFDDDKIYEALRLAHLSAYVKDELEKVMLSIILRGRNLGNMEFFDFLRLYIEKMIIKLMI